MTRFSTYNPRPKLQGLAHWNQYQHSQHSIQNWYRRTMQHHVKRNVQTRFETNSYKVKGKTNHLRWATTQNSWQNHHSMWTQTQVSTNRIRNPWQRDKRTWVENLRLVKRIETLSDDTLSKYADSFNGLGCITDIVHHIQIDPKLEPVVHPPRKVPVTIRSKVKEKLQRME